MPSPSPSPSPPARPLPAPPAPPVMMYPVPPPPTPTTPAVPQVPPGASVVHVVNSDIAGYSDNPDPRSPSGLRLLLVTKDIEAHLKRGGKIDLRSPDGKQVISACWSAPPPGSPESPVPTREFLDSLSEVAHSWVVAPTPAPAPAAPPPTQYSRAVGPPHNQPGQAFHRYPTGFHVQLQPQPGHQQVGYRPPTYQQALQHLAGNRQPPHPQPGHQQTAAPQQLGHTQPGSQQLVQQQPGQQQPGQPQTGQLQPGHPQPIHHQPVRPGQPPRPLPTYPHPGHHPIRPHPIYTHPPFMPPAELHLDHIRWGPNQIYSSTNPRTSMPRPPRPPANARYVNADAQTDSHSTQAVPQAPPRDVEMKAEPDVDMKTEPVEVEVEVEAEAKAEPHSPTESTSSAYTYWRAATPQSADAAKTLASLSRTAAAQATGHSVPSPTARSPAASTHTRRTSPKARSPIASTHTRRTSPTARSPTASTHARRTALSRGVREREPIALESMESIRRRRRNREVSRGEEERRRNPAREVQRTPSPTDMDMDDDSPPRSRSPREHRLSAARREGRDESPRR